MFSCFRKKYFWMFWVLDVKSFSKKYFWLLLGNIDV